MEGTEEFLKHFSLFSFPVQRKSQNSQNWKYIYTPKMLAGGNKCVTS